MTVRECLADAKLEIAYFHCHDHTATDDAEASLEIGAHDRIEAAQIPNWKLVAWAGVDGDLASALS